MKPSAADQARVPFVDYNGFPLKPGERQRPFWMWDEGLCFVGCWETLPWRRFSGIATTWAEDDYNFEHSQAFIDDIIKLGCNAVVVPYDCGYGESFIEDDVQMTKTLIELAHLKGLKVGTYFRADIVWTETLSDDELAELEGGFQIDSAGRFIQPFGSCSRNICYHHPGVLNRLKRLIQRAIIDIKTDMLHMDGMIVGSYEGNGACRCPLCTADFRTFLVERYEDDSEIAKQRFGHPFMEKVAPPANYPLDWPPFDSGPIQPHWAEWVAFRCMWTSRILAEIAALARSLNPEIVIEINNALTAVRENSALLMGTDPIGIGHYTDASWSEDAYGPNLLDNGLLIQRIRQFKLCRAVGTVGLTYMHEQEDRPLRQNFAHTAAFNEGVIGCIGFPPHMNFSNRYNVHFQTKCDFMQWLNENRHCFRDTQSAAQIAVWRPRENMTMSSRLSYASAMRMEQLLINTCRGYDTVFDESPAALAKYDVVIVPNVECMSLDQIEGLISYVEGGGGLLVGQDTAMYDLWHRRRIENPWEELFGTASAKNVVADATAEGFAGVFTAVRAVKPCCDLTFVSQGKGRAVYAPTVVDSASQPSVVDVQGGLDLSLDYTNWVAPEPADEFVKAMDWLMNGRDLIRVSADHGLLAEFLVQETTGRRLVHLVNLRPAPQDGCNLSAGFRSDVEVIFPPTDLPPKWHITRSDQETQVFFDFLDTYAVVVMQSMASEAAK